MDRRNGRTLKDDCNGTRHWLYAKSSVPIIEGKYVLRDLCIDYVDLESGKIEFTALVTRLRERRCENEKSKSIS